jgi:carbon monoxide dehydrogenase subunit G
MTTFESSLKTVSVPRKPVFGYLSDIKNFESLVPEGIVKNFVAVKNNCRFNIDGLGEVGVRLATTNPDHTIIYESDGSRPFRFDLIIDLNEQDDQSTLMKLTFRAELNMMMKMMVQKPMEDGLEMIASELVDHLNGRQWLTI